MAHSQSCYCRCWSGVRISSPMPCCIGVYAAPEDSSHTASSLRTASTCICLKETTCPEETGITQKMHPGTLRYQMATQSMVTTYYGFPRTFLTKNNTTTPEKLDCKGILPGGEIIGLRHHFGLLCTRMHPRQSNRFESCLGQLVPHGNCHKSNCSATCVHSHPCMGSTPTTKTPTCHTTHA